MKGILSFIILSTGACASSKSATEDAHASEPQQRTQAQAEIKVLANNTNKLQGALIFQETPEGVKITGSIEGFLNSGVHGFHIHEKGDCSAADGSSAGGHFNPQNKSHGNIEQEQSHLGDLGNINVDKKGKATILVLKKGATLDTSDYSYLGRSVIIHEKTDDFTTQPTGNAGARIACGVITTLSE